MIHQARMHGNVSVCSGCNEQLGTVELNESPDVYLVTSWCQPQRPGVHHQTAKIGVPRALDWLTRQHLYAWIRQPGLTTRSMSTRVNAWMKTPTSTSVTATTPPSRTTKTDSRPSASISSPSSSGRAGSPAPWGAGHDRTRNINELIWALEKLRDQAGE